MIFFIVKKIALSSNATTSGSYTRQVSSPAKEIWVDFKILYRINYSDIFFKYYYNVTTTVLKLHFSQLIK